MSLILNVRQNVGLSTSREVSLTVGARGAPGTPGPPGPPGPQGPATIDVGTTTTGAPGTNASVVNSGTNIDAVLDFTIPRGDQGDQGDPGPPGSPGAPGADGKSVLNGTGAPSNGTGNNGDFYIDTATDTIYGPKAGGVWPTPGTSLVGPQGNPGTPGTPGTDGLSVLHGTGDPTSGDGVDGEFWINTTTNYIFGPKAAGVWPSPGTSLVGPQGPPGPGQDVSAATHEPLGHKDRAESTISFNNTSRTFTIAPTGSTYEVWCAGTKYDLTTQSVTIPNTTGLYYIYFDTAGVLHYKTTYFDWPTEVPTAYVYWNSGTGKAEFFADERHGITLDWATHEYLHRTRGAAFASGFSLGSYSTAGTGAADADAQMALGNGTFFDEDLQVDIVATATPTPNTWEQNLVFPMQVPVFRLQGTAWQADTSTAYPLKQGTARAQYNLLTGSTWSSTDAGNGDYVISWLVATNNLNTPVVVVLGQSSYTSLPAARNAAWSDLVLTNFPVFEFRPLYKLIFETKTSFSNVPHARLSDVQDLRGGSAAGGGTVVSDHGLLAGLADDDHVQYALADGTRGSFDALGAAATVQTNLNTHTALTTTAHGGIVPDTRTVTAGTGLSGGGALSANVTLTVNYGTTAGTAAQGNDSRITGAVPSTRSIIAGTGLSGGGDLSADRTLSVSFGTTSGTAAQGNDSRIVNAVQTSRSISTGTGLSGGGDLTADRTLSVVYGTTSGTAAQGNDSRITGAVQSSLVDAKGDLLVGTANDTVTRLAVGTNNYVLTADSTTAEGVKWAVASGSTPIPGLFGTGEDGNVTISSNSTVTSWNTTGAQFKQYENLTINSGVTVTLTGGIIFVRGTLTLNGTIANNGGTPTGVTTGGSSSNGPWQTTATNGGGAASTTVGGAGSPGASPTSGAVIAWGGAGGTGGTGASGAGGISGIAPALGTSATTEANSQRMLWGLISGLIQTRNAVPYMVAGSGRGGGAGGGDIVATAYNGGPGGGGGGCTIIIANKIAGTGTIECKGGNGKVGQGGNTGGGGGGGGGFIGIITNSTTQPWTLNVSGGTGAAGTGTGTSGGNGSAGNTVIMLGAT